MGHKFHHGKLSSQLKGEISQITGFHQNPHTMTFSSTPPSTSSPTHFHSKSPTFLYQYTHIPKRSLDWTDRCVGEFVPVHQVAEVWRMSHHGVSAAAVSSSSDQGHHHQHQQHQNRHSTFPDSPLQLVKLQVWIRHGPRTFLTHLPNYEKLHGVQEWKCPPYVTEYLQQHHFYDAKRHAFEQEYSSSNATNGAPAQASSEDSSDSDTTRNLAFNLFYQREDNILRGNCGSGQLTSIGWHYMERIGSFLRYRYGKLDPQDTYVRTTDSHPRRTEDSTKAILLGWMPDQGQNNGDNTGDETISWDIYRVEPRREYFYNRESHCPRLKVLYRQFKASQLVEDEKQRLKRELEPRLRETLQMEPKQRMPSIRTLYNTIDCILTDLKPLKLPQDQINDVKEHALWYYGKRYASHDRLIGRLAISRAFDLLLQNIDARLERDANQQRQPYRSKNIHSPAIDKSTEIYLCHDQTLLPMLSCLHQKLRRWPGFGSWIAYETFRDKEDNEYYIRVVWDGVPLDLSRDGFTSQPTGLEEVTKYANLRHLYRYEDFRKLILQEVCFKSYREACRPVEGEVVFEAAESI